MCSWLGQRPDLVAKSTAPDYSLGAHVAPLGLTFYSADSTGLKVVQRARCYHASSLYSPDVAPANIVYQIYVAPVNIIGQTLFTQTNVAAVNTIAIQ